MCVCRHERLKPESNEKRTNHLQDGADCSQYGPIKDKLWTNEYFEFDVAKSECRFYSNYSLDSYTTTNVPLYVCTNKAEKPSVWPVTQKSVRVKMVRRTGFGNRKWSGRTDLRRPNLVRPD